MYDSEIDFERYAWRQDFDKSYILIINMHIPEFKGEIAEDHATLVAHSRDASLFEVMPKTVVFPRDADDVKALVRFVHANPALKLSLTARAAGTDMTGGPLNESIIVDFTRHMNRIKEIGHGFVIVEPGLYYRDLERALAERGMLLPSYPASKNICAVGGMVANNSGGEKTLRYGKTERYVKRLKVVLSDGNEYIFQSLHPFEVRKKTRLDSFEGSVYRDIFNIIKENSAVIHAAKPQVSKNSAGYSLWDVWDGKRFDLTKLFVGSQGTLGLITEISFKVIRPKRHARLLVIFMNDMAALARFVKAALAHDPESFESYDKYTFRLGIRYLFFKFALQFIPEIGMIIKNRGFPKLVLLVEFTGDSNQEAYRKAWRAMQDFKRFNVLMRITASPRDTEKYWAIRRESFNLLRTKIKGKQTAPFIDDIIVSPNYLSEFLPALETLLKPYEQDMTYTIAGHMGNGNFHIIPFMNLHSARARHIIPELSAKVYDLVLKYHGSITAEHNDGLIRTPYVEKMYGERVYGLFKKIKHAFDPRGIFNPGKKVGGSIAYAMAHIRKK